MSQLPIVLRALLSGLLVLSGIKCAKVPLVYRHKLLPSRVLYPPGVSTCVSAASCKCAASVHMAWRPQRERERERERGLQVWESESRGPQVLSQQAVIVRERVLPRHLVR